MIATTTHTETTTYVTADDGTLSVSHDTRVDVEFAYLFHELGPKAKERAVREAIKEEEILAYEGRYTWTLMGSSESEMWGCARDLEKQQPVHFYVDPGGSPAAEPRSKRFGYDAWMEVTEATDDGVCYSMDLCDVWNRYAPRIMALAAGVEDADAAAYEEEDEELAMSYARIADRCAEVAEELTEEAARAVGDTLDSLVEANSEWYASPEFWHEWLDDGETRFDVDGRRL